MIDDCYREMCEDEIDFELMNCDFDEMSLKLIIKFDSQFLNCQLHCTKQTWLKQMLIIVISFLL